MCLGVFWSPSIQMTTRAIRLLSFNLFQIIKGWQSHNWNSLQNLMRSFVFYSVIINHQAILPQVPNLKVTLLFWGIYSLKGEKKWWAAFLESRECHWLMHHLIIFWQIKNGFCTQKTLFMGYFSFKGQQLIHRIYNFIFKSPVLQAFKVNHLILLFYL